MDLTDLTFLHFILALLGLSFLIFVHELGHFLAAKKVGIRVEAFCIGFQPTILGFKARFFAYKRGDTEYALGMIPFGGYVKMAGEEPGDEKTGSGDEFSSKTVGERAVVLVAGSVMNLIFGFLFFIVAFTIGFKTESSTLGTVQPFGPAWEAGLQPGDKILEIDGSPKKEFLEVVTTIALGNSDTAINLLVEEPGASEPRTIAVTPKINPARGMPFIGVERAMTWEIGDVGDDSPASRAGVKQGDRITSVKMRANDSELTLPDGLHPNRGWSYISLFASSQPGGVITLGLDSEESGPRTVDLTVETVDPDPDGRPILGVQRATRTIRGIQPGSDAANVFTVGWEITRLGGEPLPHLSALAIARVAGERQELAFETATGETGTVSAADLIRWIGQEVVLTPENNRIIEVKPGSPLAALGVKPGDRLVEIAGERVAGPSQLQTITPESAKIPVAWWSALEKTTQQGEITVKPGESLDLDVAFDGSVFVGSVTPGTAAEKAGLQPGDKLAKINGEDLKEWSDLTSRISVEVPASWWQFWQRKPVYEANSIELDYDRSGATSTISFTPAPSASGRIGLSPSSDKVLLKSNVLDACIQGPKRAWIWSQRVFSTLKSLVTGQVAPKNLAGPVGIVSVGTAASKQGIGFLIFILALISVNLGIFNLMPFPILDGGHLVFLLIEKIKGSPVSDRIQGWSFTVAFFILIGLAIFVTYHDILRIL